MNTSETNETWESVWGEVKQVRNRYKLDLVGHGRGHHMRAHLRTEAYPVYREHQYPPRSADDEKTELSYERNILLIDEAKRGLE